MTKILMLTLLITSSVYATVSDSDCLRLPGEIDRFIESEIETFRNINRYLDSNTNGWRTAHNLISSGDLTRRRYNGNFATNARVSEQNRQAMSQRINEISRMKSQMVRMLEQCVR